MELHISKDGFSSVDVQASATPFFHIKVDKRINASLLLTYSGVSAVMQGTIQLEEGSSLTMMMKNEMQEHVDVKIHGEVNRDATLSLAFCELEDGQTKNDVRIDLLEEGASTLLRSASIVHNEKNFHMVCTHAAPHTSGIMEHYAVVEDGGKYQMEACGKINKGALGSASHQTTRVLTMSEHHTSVVIPLLLIDENDVKASHATTLGQPDEDQLYYLQTRGLSRKQALGLLSVGYIMPIAQMFEDEGIHEKLKNEIEMKVGLHA